MKKVTPYEKKEFINIGIVGMNAVGASIARALRRSDNFNVVGVDGDNAVLDYCFDNGFIQLGNTDYGILRGCEVVFICVRQEYVLDSIYKAFEVVGDLAILTDTSPIMHSVMSQLPVRSRFVGGYPAINCPGGAEKSLPDMFDGVNYYISSGAHSSERDIMRIKEFAEYFGSNVVLTDSIGFDTAYAKACQLPALLRRFTLENIVESKLAAGLADNTPDGSADFKADRQFLAGLVLNRERVITELTNVLMAMSAMKLDIQNGNINRVNDALQRRLPIGSRQTPNNSVSVDVKGDTGTIGEVCLVLSKRGLAVKNLEILKGSENAGALSLSFSSPGDAAVAVEILTKKKYRVKIS